VAVRQPWGSPVSLVAEPMAARKTLNGDRRGSASEQRMRSSTSGFSELEPCCFAESYRRAVLSMSDGYGALMDAISVSGVQGTGKSTLARALGHVLGAVVLSRGPLMDVLLAAGVPVDPSDQRLKGVGELAYDLQAALLREQLSMGHSVVLDCGAGRDVRESWRRVADEAGAAFWLIDTVCSDVDLHRRRFEDRGPIWGCDIGQTWEMVDELRVQFRPHPQAALIADATRSVEENVDCILALIRSEANPCINHLPGADRLMTAARAGCDRHS
jgi:predicted kinase